MNWIIKRFSLLLVGIALLFSLALGIALNTEVSYVSIARNHPHASLLGVNCILQGSWYVHGWRSFDNPKEIGSYELTKSSLKINRYVHEVFKLEPNSQIMVADVKVADSIFLDRTELEIEISNFQHRADINIEHANEVCPNWQLDKTQN